MLEILVAGAMVLALLLFALAGGADFGGGMWTFIARGETAEQEASLIDRAIGPIWEANELWIVVALVILWSGFPSVFATFGIALFIPLILVLVGIMLRGAFFAFQEHAEFAPVRRAFIAFGKAYGAVSVIAPFFFGLAAGAIASGRLRFERAGADAERFAVGTPTGGYFASWLGPFPILCGLLALATCAYLAAVYLTVEADDEPELQDLYRKRGIISGSVLGALGVAALPVMSFDAEYLRSGVFEFPAIIFLAAAALALVGSLMLLYARRYWWARSAAIAQVVAVFCAWASAQYPYLIVPDVTISDAASPGSVLVALLILSFFYAIVLGPSLALLFYIFKRRPSQTPDPPKSRRRRNNRDARGAGHRGRVHGQDHRVGRGVPHLLCRPPPPPPQRRTLRLCSIPRCPLSGEFHRRVRRDGGHRPDGGEVGVAARGRRRRRRAPRSRVQPHVRLAGISRWREAMVQLRGVDGPRARAFFPRACPARAHEARKKARRSRAGKGGSRSLPPDRQETPEHFALIEKDMREIQTRMSPNLRDLRSHTTPKSLGESTKRSVRERLRGLLRNRRSRG